MEWVGFSPVGCIARILMSLKMKNAANTDDDLRVQTTAAVEVELTWSPNSFSNVHYFLYKKTFYKNTRLILAQN